MHVKWVKRSVPVHGVVSSFEPDASRPAEELLPECGGVLHRLLDALLELLPDSRHTEEVGRLRLLQRRNQRTLHSHAHTQHVYHLLLQTVYTIAGQRNSSFTKNPFKQSNYKTKKGEQGQTFRNSGIEGQRRSKPIGRRHQKQDGKTQIYIKIIFFGFKKLK